MPPLCGSGQFPESRSVRDLLMVCNAARKLSNRNIHHWENHHVRRT
jgi:hypothetical protein